MEINDSRKNLYSILEIDINASIDDIKKAYRKLAIKYHPDKSTQEYKIVNEEKFKLISEAYNILSDPNKRKIYDETGCVEDIDEILKFNERQKNMFNIFGSFMNPMNTIRFNPDIIITLRLELETIFVGQIIDYTIERSILIIDDLVVPKYQKEKEKIKIIIPEGVANGEKIIMHGLGNKMVNNNKNNKVGNIVVIVEEVKHKIFNRSPNQPLHLYMNQKISVFQALIGEFDVVVTGLNKEKIYINMGKNVIKPNMVMCIEGKGMKKSNKYGNLYVIFDIEFMDEITDTQRTVLKSVSNYVETKNKNKDNCKWNMTNVSELNDILNQNDRDDENNDFGGVQCAQQ
jgi:DnaJ family protein B protein 4